MNDNVFELISALSIKSKLEKYRDDELESYKRHYTSLINGQPNLEEMISESWNRASKQIKKTYNPLINQYAKKLEACNHEIVFVNEEEQLKICACCDHLVDGEGIINVNVPSDKMTPESLNELRQAILVYLFFNPDYTSEGLTEHLNSVISNEEELKLCLRKKED